MAPLLYNHTFLDDELCAHYSSVITHYFIINSKALLLYEHISS